jgi:hypothetical protein
MLSRLRRPSPALIISIIALVMAMASTGYAAFKLPKNSVGAKQIKKNAVTGAKVKNQSLTGKDIKLSKLGTVPSATNAAHATAADHATSADSIPAAEATHLVGTAGQPGFEGGSGNLPGESGVQFKPVGFFKDHEGIVHLQGLALSGESGPVPGVVFRLPPGFRPASGTVLVTNIFCSGFIGSGTCTEDEGLNEERYASMLVGGSNTALEKTNFEGVVFVPPGTAVSLDGVTFRAES